MAPARNCSTTRSDGLWRATSPSKLTTPPAGSPSLSATAGSSTMVGNKSRNVRLSSSCVRRRRGTLPNDDGGGVTGGSHVHALIATATSVAVSMRALPDDESGRRESRASDRGEGVSRIIRSGKLHED